MYKQINDESNFEGHLNLLFQMKWLAVRDQSSESNFFDPFRIHWSLLSVMFSKPIEMSCLFCLYKPDASAKRAVCVSVVVSIRYVLNLSRQKVHFTCIDF